jgi:hypothetical protein
MTEDNNKKDNRSNRSNIPSREGQAPRPDGARDQGRRPGRHRRPHQSGRDQGQRHDSRPPMQGGAPRAEGQQGNNSEQRPDSNSNRRPPPRNHRNNRHRGNNRGGPNDQRRNSQGQGQQQNKQPQVQKPKHHLSPEERVVNQYWIHLEEYLQARRGHYVHAHSENESQRIKYKRAYLRALEKWRTWQDGLSDHEKIVLNRRNYEHKLENSYSLKHEIVYDRTQIDWTGPFVDQHFLPRQIEANYQGDVEETHGTMEDYQRIKDGFVPAKYRET